MLPPMQPDPRTMVQLSAFTVHATPRPLESFPASERFLRKYLVPAAAKRTLRNTLKQLGITDSYLFPDLPHLAAEEKSKCFCRSRPCPHSETRWG